MKSTKIGRPSSSKCPRSGFSCLENKITGRTYVLKTRCRQWDCLACRDRNLEAVQRRIEYGCWMQSGSLLITITYKFAGRSTLRSNDVVLRDLGRLFGLMKRRSRYRNLSWFKVPELTKKKQIHLHLVVGGVEAPVVAACEREPNYGRAWRRRACVCVEHTWSKVWERITGDSYVVDASEVLSGAKAASYLGKYLVKGMADRRELVRRGFVNRWSCSRNWPRGELLMTGTARGLWRKITFVGGKDAGLRKRAEEDVNSRALARVGAAEAMAFDARKQRNRLRKRLEGMLDNLYTTPALEGHGDS